MVGVVLIVLLVVLLLFVILAYNSLVKLKVQWTTPGLTSKSN